MKAMVIIPTYNERDNIETVVRAVLDQGEHFYVTIVDDNSPDGTGKIADQLAEDNTRVHVIHRPSKQGLGVAYVTGFKYAMNSNADYIIEMDADLSHDPSVLPQFLEKMDEYDVVIGSRYADGLAVVHWPLHRLLLSLLANLYARWVTGLDLSDCTSGFKCFKREVLEQIDLSMLYANGYAFQVEMNYRAHRLHYRLGELPIVFYERTAGESKMSTKIARQAFQQILWMRLSNILHLGNIEQFDSRQSNPIPWWKSS